MSEQEKCPACGGRRFIRRQYESEEQDCPVCVLTDLSPAERVAAMADLMCGASAEIRYRNAWSLVLSYERAGKGRQRGVGNG